jgi:hypothetical protein
MLGISCLVYFIFYVTYFQIVNIFQWNLKIFTLLSSARGPDVASSVLGQPLIWCSQNLMQQFVLFSTCQCHKDIDQYPPFDIFKFWIFQLRIFSPATTAYPVQPNLGAAIYTNNGVEQFPI